MDDQLDGSIIGDLSNLSQEISECNSVADSKFITPAYTDTTLPYMNDHHYESLVNNHEYEEIKSIHDEEEKQFIDINNKTKI